MDWKDIVYVVFTVSTLSLPSGFLAYYFTTRNTLSLILGSMIFVTYLYFLGKKYFTSFLAVNILFLIIWYITLEHFSLQPDTYFMILFLIPATFLGRLFSAIIKLAKTNNFLDYFKKE